jgi:hypothetical protein
LSRKTNGWKCFQFWVMHAISGIRCALRRGKNVPASLPGGHEMNTDLKRTTTKARALVTTAAAFLFIVALVGAAGEHANAATTTTFSGQATAVRGSIPAAGSVLPTLLPCMQPSATQFCIADTGPLSATEAVQGGAHEAALACYPSGNGCVITSPVGDPTNGAVKARVLNAAVVARGNQSRAEASAANVALNVGGVAISADFLTAEATAKCQGGSATVSASSEVARVNGQPVLGVNGIQVAVSETPNFDVVAALPPAVQAVLPSGTAIIINKQSSGPNGSGGQQIDVTALYVNVPGVAELFIADAHADITCAALSQCPGQHMFVTSGGFIDPSGSDKQHFTAAARHLTNWGHLLFRDSVSGYSLHVKNPYGVVYNSFATLKADADANGFHTALLDATKFQGGAIVTWTDQGGGKALLVDEGEPGRSDYFEIIAPNAVTGGLLAGGNIQMHGRCGVL